MAGGDARAALVDLTSAPAGPLPDVEAACVQGAHRDRRREFGVGRVLARSLLDELGLPVAALLPGERGAPRWPDGAVGSISHCDEACAALVGRAKAWRFLGVDLEEDEPLPERVGPRVMLPEERAALADGAAPGREGRLVFSVKECVYKALAPVVDRVLAFHEVGVTFVGGVPGEAVTAGRFTARFVAPEGRPDGAPEVLDGRWWARGGLLLSALASPRD